jgi:FdhD protein
MIQTFRIKRIRESSIEEIEDWVIEETPLTIVVNGQELVTVVCTPEKEELLAIGFLGSEGIVGKIEDIRDYSVDGKTRTVTITLNGITIDDKILSRRRLVTSGCGRGISFYTYEDALKSTEITQRIEISPERAFTLMKQFQRQSSLFLRTGGAHSAALAKEDILLFAEDIGRHNAVDKIIGEALVKRVSFGDKILLSSGRISSEVILKAAKIGIPAIISRSAPTSIAINIARELNMTLMGFVRGKKANIYS